MTGKLLQAIGVLTVLALVAGAVAGFGVLKDRVRIIVQDDDADVGLDPTALLRDDVASLARHVRNLQQAVAKNFEQLATGLEDSAENRHGDVRGLVQQVRTLAKDLQSFGAVMSVVQAKVLAWQPPASPPAGSPTEVAGDEPTSQPVVEQPREAEPVAVTPVVDSTVESTLEPTAPPAVQPPPKRKGFLSFSLPSTSLAFDEQQDYVLLPQLCRVGFDAKSTLHDFTGVTSAVTGRFRCDFDDALGLCVGEIVVTTTAMKTGVEGRDTNMWEHLDSKNHPQIRFALERFHADAKGVDVAGKKASGKVVGKMTIRGNTRTLSMPVKIEVDPQQRVVITGQAKLLLSDYGVPVPSQLGVINMEDEVVVWVALRARAQTGKTE